MIGFTAEKAPSQNGMIFWLVLRWVHHGAADPTVKVEGSRKMVEALKQIQGNVKYTEYDEASGIKHNAWDPCYSNDEVFEWIFAQSRGEKKAE